MHFPTTGGIRAVQGAPGAHFPTTGGIRAAQDGSDVHFPTTDGIRAAQGAFRPAVDGERGPVPVRRAAPAADADPWRVANRLYRLDTDRGSYAVKELNLIDRRWRYRAEEVFRFERAAFAAGIPMPEPIAVDPRTLVHRWVDRERVPEEPVPTAYAFEVGEILARRHGLDVAWTLEQAENRTPRNWPELAARATTSNQPWADELAAEVDTFQAIADVVDGCVRPGPVVLTHNDIQL